MDLPCPSRLSTILSPFAHIPRGRFVLAADEVHMHYHEIEKARRRLRHAGTVEDRAQFRQSMIARLRDDIEVLGHRKEAKG